MNDYLRLKQEEVDRQSISRNISISMGPYVEKMFKRLDTLLTDYKDYRDMIEDQVKKINAAFEKDTITESPEVAASDTPQPQTPECDLPMEHYLHLYRTLPTILPDLINQKLSSGQAIDENAIDSIMDTLVQNPEYNELFPSFPANSEEGGTPSARSTPRKSNRKSTPIRRQPQDVEGDAKRQRPSEE